MLIILLQTLGQIIPEFKYVNQENPLHTELRGDIHIFVFTERKN